MRFKNFGFIFIAVIMLFIFGGCGDSESPEEAPNGEPVDTGIVELSESESIEPVESESIEPVESESIEPSDTPSVSPDESAKPSKSPGYKTFSGYLLDCKCGHKGKDTRGNDMTTHPEKHTLKCLKDKTRAASGYGLAIKQKSTGKYEFFPFDDKGSKLVKRYIVDKTKKTNALLIAVRGWYEDDLIKVDMVLSYGLE